MPGIIEPMNALHILPARYLTALYSNCKPNELESCLGNHSSRTHGIVFQHTEGPMCSRSHHRLVISGQGHGDQTYGYGAGLGC